MLDDFRAMTMQYPLNSSGQAIILVASTDSVEERVSQAAITTSGMFGEAPFVCGRRIQLPSVLKNLVNGLSRQWTKLGKYWRVPNSASIT